MDRKLDGNAAGFANALAHPLGEFEMMPVAGAEIRTGLGDANDRLARLQLCLAEAEIEIAFEIKRSHIRI